MRLLLFIFFSTIICFPFSSKGADPLITPDPLTIAKRIGDKLVRETPFAWRLELSPESKLFNGMQVIDFGRSLPSPVGSAAYAFTQLEAPENMKMEMQLGYSGKCRIWLNGELIYQNNQEQKLELVFDERSVELSHSFTANLKKGINSLLIKGVSNQPEWRIYLQPPSAKGAVQNTATIYPGIGLKNLMRVDKKIADLTNWLVIGPFNEDDQMEKSFSALKEPDFGQIFQGNTGAVTWGIPKIDVIGNLIDPLPWGTNYNWNYHNGGLAWAMKILGEMSAEKAYEKYADDFCDFQLKSIPFLKYETEVLGKTDVPNGLLINTPLLDFTLAPSLPFIYRLRKEKAFVNQEEYKLFISKMLRYARYEQIRLPGSSVYTRTTPKKYTTWVDDMFMGIPFLLQAGMYAEKDSDRVWYFNDAATQFLDFNKELWDFDSKLYVHASYSGQKEKMIHWSRANGWGIWAASEVLSYLPKNHSAYKAILKQYRSHSESLLKLQDKDGFWLNVLDVPSSQQEVSGTAIFTMALARGLREGWIKGEQYKAAVVKGWNAVASQIEKDGTVHKICYGTMCSSDLNYYLQRPFYDNDTHGLFAILFAAMEVSRLTD